MGGKDGRKFTVKKPKSGTDSEALSVATPNEVSAPKTKKPERVASKMVHLFDAIVECLKMHLFLLSYKDLHRVKGEAEELITAVENLQVYDNSGKPSSSHFATTMTENLSLEDKVKSCDHRQDDRSKEKILAERKAKAAEAKARKAATVEAKKMAKKVSVDANASQTMKKVKEQENRYVEMVKTDQQSVAPMKCLKDPGPGLPSALRTSQPFKAVYFDLPTVDDDSEGPSAQLSCSEMVGSSVHPAFFEFASRCEAKHIVGIDAICVAFVQSFKQFLPSYTISPNQVMSRDLDRAVGEQLSYLTENGKHSFPLALGNLIRQLKKEINQLPDSISEKEGKERLEHWLDDFVQQNFELSLQAISSFCLKKMKNTHHVLTYSWCPVVERIILDAHKNKLLLHVYVLDSPIERRGKQLVKTLCGQQIRCSYGMLSSVGYLMKKCHMVLLGCSAILSNGFAVAERGTSQVALVASALNIPVLVAAQTCKFVDRVQSFSHGVHEVSALVGEGQETIPSELITAIVTELRILPPSSAPAVLEAKQLVVD